MRRLSIILCAGSIACSEADSDECFIGDVNRAIELQIVHRAIGGGVVQTQDGGEVPLILPPQGGKVMLIGVRAKNLDACPITLTSGFRDPGAEDLLALEQRSVILVEGPDGWGEPKEPLALHNYSNLPACPREGLSRNVYDEPYELEVLVEDKSGRRASSTQMIVPKCAEPEFEESCRCECSKDYDYGESCN